MLSDSYSSKCTFGKYIQLKIKLKQVKDLLMRMDNEIWKFNRDMRTHIEQNRKKFEGLSFQMMPIAESPVTEGYRNKCEFTVGIDDQTSLPTVGLRLGSYATGTVAVAPLTGLAHISLDMKMACLLFEEFVRASGMMPFSPADYSGHWRQLTVRQSHSTGEIMLVVALYRQQLTDEHLDQLKNKLVEHFSSKEAKQCKITSLYYEIIHKRRSGEEGTKPVHLMGSTHITETILGRKFRISPQAFFQTNTLGTEILYQSAIDMCCPRQDTTVVDICCGTGTIGLCFAKHCSRVLGVELVPEAVLDAKHNAQLNNIDNCEFFTGRAEDTLPSVLARALTDDVVAIVDPPRAGLHMRAVTQLRNNEKVNRLVYISCSPTSALKNLVDLARPTSKTLRGAPFVPVRAVPVDLFPHTKHVELAVLFERSPKENEEDTSKNEEESSKNKEKTSMNEEKFSKNVDSSMNKEDTSNNEEDTLKNEENMLRNKENTSGTGENISKNDENAQTGIASEQSLDAQATEKADDVNEGVLTSG